MGRESAVLQVRRSSRRRIWCYIDVTNCDRPHQTGLYFAASSYSFATCGYKDTFAPEISREDIFVQQHLNGKTLRVTFPGDWLWSLWTEPNGDRGGLYPSIISKVFREYAVNWKVQPLSNSSKAFSPDSTYHACVHDVAIAFALMMPVLAPLYKQVASGGCNSASLMHGQPDAPRGAFGGK